MSSPISPRKEPQSPKQEVKEEDIDASIQDEIITSPAFEQPADSMNMDGSTDAATETRDGVSGVSLIPDAPDLGPRIPAKKDATLREFLGKMDDYAPIIPDAVTNHYLSLAGLPPPPHTSPQLARLLALATQKFVADIAADAYQYARIRTSHTTSNTANNPLSGVTLPPAAVAAVPTVGGKDGDKTGGKGASALGVQRPGYGGGGSGGGQGRTVLTMEDLGMAVGEYGVNIKRGEFYR